MNNYYLYYHYTLDTNELFYIGRGKGRRAIATAPRNVWWKRKVAKHGFRSELILIELTTKEANFWEIEMIRFHRERGDILVNLTSGGEGTAGWIPSAETRAKLSAIHTGRRPWNLGHRWSIETRKKISIARTGQHISMPPRTPEHNDKLGATHKGKTIGPEQRKLISKIHTGKIVSAETRKKMGAWQVGRIRSPETRAKISATQKRRFAEKCSQL